MTRSRILDEPPTGPTVAPRRVVRIDSRPDAPVGQAPAPVAPAPASFGRLDVEREVPWSAHVTARLLVAWLVVVVVVGTAIEPVTTEELPPMSLGEVVWTGAVAVALLGLFGSAGSPRWLVRWAGFTGVLLVVASLACPATGHHTELGAWWWWQLGLGASVPVAAVALAWWRRRAEETLPHHVRSVVVTDR